MGEQFYKRYLSHPSLKLAWKLLIYLKICSNLPGANELMMSVHHLSLTLRNFIKVKWFKISNTILNIFRRTRSYANYPNTLFIKFNQSLYMYFDRQPLCMLYLHVYYFWLLLINLLPCFLYPPYPKDRGMLRFYVEAARRPSPAARNGVNAITQKPGDGLFSNLVYTLVMIVSWPD